jgi:HAD superfamily hydrolase (TIGR01509 family)
LTDKRPGHSLAKPYSFVQLDIPSGDFTGYIFDLDGTLIDTMPIHYLAWDRVLHRFGLRQTLGEGLFYSLGGMSTPRTAETLGEHYRLKLDPTEVARQKEIIYKELLLTAKVPLIEPVAAVARKVAGRYPLAVVTGGSPDVAEAGLAAGGLQDLFSLVITPLDVPPGRGKPAPDMFLLAAKRMGVPPGGCLVFEDAELGIAGARAAGMQVVIVSSQSPTIRTP